ncbi:hypothetical protein OOZ15_16170 [Galbibacter sp. EGI 63066]|nr:hypothetical protein [Galbibacter sp. EGI 63066]MCX2681490.1 hypothetical protein [Galbibacter sp. EGI 63066]
MDIVKESTYDKSLENQGSSRDWDEKLFELASFFSSVAGDAVAFS